MCTLRNFPNLIEHCIEWGRDKFNGLFVDGPADLVSFLDNPKAFVARCKVDGTTTTLIEKLNKCKELMKLKQNGSFEAVVAMAKEQFNAFFDFAIQDLLFTFPLDAKDKEGNPFWSGPKRAPKPITFDANNATHVNFIVPMANLIAVALGMKENRDVTAITDMAANAKVTAYVQKKADVQLPEEQKEGGNQPAAQA